LLQAVRQQANAARRGKQAESCVHRQFVVRHQGSQGHVDIGLQAGELCGLLDEARNHLGRLKQRQQGRRTRVAIGVDVVAKPGQRQTGRQIVRQHRIFTLARHFTEQRLHAP
jgi:hypothetical protein